MARTSTPPTPFAAWLQAELKERKRKEPSFGVRTLARQIDPANPEIARRALNRYLAGSWPNEANRDKIAAALDVPEGDMPRKSDDDEEESELLSALAPLAQLLKKAGVPA